MMREFQLTLSSTATSIFALLVAGGFCDSLGNMLISAAKNNAIIPDRVRQLKILPAGAVTLTVRDNSGSTTTGATIPAAGLDFNANRNSICLRDYLLNNSGNTDAAWILLEAN